MLLLLYSYKLYLDLKAADTLGMSQSSIADRMDNRGEARAYDFLEFGDFNFVDEYQKAVLQMLEKEKKAISSIETSLAKCSSILSKIKVVLPVPGGPITTVGCFLSNKFMCVTNPFFMFFS